MKLTPVLIAGALALGALPLSAEARSWHCERSAFSDKAEKQRVADLAHNNAMWAIVIQHRARWDAAHMRAQCEAFAAGRSAEIGCLNGRRDWGAIRASIPAEYFRMSQAQLAPLAREAQDTPDGLREAVAYCADVGAIER